MIDLPSNPMGTRIDEDGDRYCTRTGKRIATIDELSAGYGRELIRKRLAAERAQAERQTHAPALDATPAQPRRHGAAKRVRATLK